MKPTKKQMQKLWRHQKLARTRSVIYDGILIFMTVLYSTIILISRRDIFFHQGTEKLTFEYNFQYTGSFSFTASHNAENLNIRPESLGWILFFLPTGILFFT